jgi:hypothetical protein
MTKIKGGYYLKARCIQESDIAHAPPHVREIWDYLLREVNYQDKKYDGIIIKRGQTIRTYKDIQEALSWKIGWRKMTYSKWDCEKAMKVLMKATMITTQKTTRGMIITVLNYDKFQTPENYESHTEDHRRATREPQTTDTINKKEKKERKKEEIYITLTEQIEPLRNSYPPSMIDKFILYWDETDTKKTPRWKKEKTWDISKRLERWRRNQEEWDYQKSPKPKLEEQPTRESQPVRIDKGLSKFDKEYFEKYKAYPLP